MVYAHLSNEDWVRKVTVRAFDLYHVMDSDKSECRKSEMASKVPRLF